MVQQQRHHASCTYLDQVNAQSATGKHKRPTIAPHNHLALWADGTLHDGSLRRPGFGAGVRYGSALCCRGAKRTVLGTAR